MKHWLCVLALGWFAASAQASPGDEAILAARDAFSAGDRVRVSRALDAARGHDLEPYVAYWQLRQRLEEATQAEIEGFLEAHEGAYVAERLRSDWLKLLGKSRVWSVFDREVAKIAQPDPELACFALQSRINRRDAAALDEARPLWFNMLDLPGSCMPVMEQLIIDGRLTANDMWERMRRLLEAKRLGAAKHVGAYLPEREAPDPKLLDLVADSPKRYLDKLKPNFAATRLGREMAMYALQRIARNDPQAAAAEFEPLKARFSAAEREYVYGQLGWQAALRHLPEALPWYKAAQDVMMSDEQIAWKARAALRAKDWRAVQDTIEKMPAALAAEPTWIYWLGRAQQALGRRDDAKALFQRISGQPHFYSNLADEELGQPIALPPRSPETSLEDLTQVAKHPGVRRALALFRIDMRVEAVREWNWTMRGQDDRFLLAAAQLAKQNQIFDRAIHAADRTVEQHDYALRYLAPFRDYVEPRARALDLDEAWVYGLMRQESRFVMNARSSTGAQGLMQLMPATARWVAGKIGLKDFALSGVNDMNTNVMLGTSYLKMVLQDLDNHPVLASAAYNAGPGRARRWRDAKPLEGAIYAETIPLNETRDYVKKVMSNAVYYDALFNGQPQSLKMRLGVISPGGANGKAAAAP